MDIRATDGKFRARMVFFALKTAFCKFPQGTLEEAVEADLLLHVVDASSADAGAQHAAVLAILRQLGMTDSQLASKVRLWKKC